MLLVIFDKTTEKILLHWMFKDGNSKNFGIKEQKYIIINIKISK